MNQREKINTRKIESGEKNKGMIQRLEMFIGMVKLAFEFVEVFVKAISVEDESSSAEMNYVAQTPYIGLLP